jgi:hypothetical protein
VAAWVLRRSTPPVAGLPAAQNAPGPVAAGAAPSAAAALAEPATASATAAPRLVPPESTPEASAEPTAAPPFVATPVAIVTPPPEPPAAEGVAASRARALIGEGDRQRRQGRVDAAVDRYAAALALDPDQSTARERIRDLFGEQVAACVDACSRRDLAAAERAGRRAVDLRARFPALVTADRVRACDACRGEIRTAPAVTPATARTVAAVTPAPATATRPVSTATPEPAAVVATDPCAAQFEAAMVLVRSNPSDRAPLISYVRSCPRGAQVDEALERLEAPTQGEVALRLLREVRRSCRSCAPDGLLNQRQAVTYLACLGIAPCIGFWEEAKRLRPDDYSCIQGLTPPTSGPPQPISIPVFAERIKDLGKHKRDCR